ncbi:MarR family winged helix-turn-helix transcriptional regulator [Tessaracoccus sp.]
MKSDDPWLTEDEQRAWRDWLAVSVQLPAVLHRQLQRDSSLSLQDFEVLVHLTETVEHRARVADLAQALQWERSRLSHHVKRMESRGLVARSECAEDGRGAYVELTEWGLAAIRQAAPGHARIVKELVFSSLTARELQSFTSVTEKILANIDGPATDSLVPPRTRTSSPKEVA